MVIDELLVYVRAIFLEIVRVKYWHFIEIGKLPRLSFSAQFLLYTIEVGLDDVNLALKSSNTVLCSFDWQCLEAELNSRTPVIDVLQFLHTNFPGNNFFSNTVVRFLSFLETRREKREVYMLTSFIEAHEHAQSKIHKFLGLDEEEGEDGNRTEALPQTPEEAKVIAESSMAVRLLVLFLD
jgi:hypothetical protein